MKTTVYKQRRRGTSETVAIFVVCFLAAALLGSVGAYFAKVFEPNIALAPFAPGWVVNSIAWIVSYAFLGIALYFAITADTLTKIKYTVRRCMLWFCAALFILSMLAPFLVYAYHAYLVSFVLLAVNISVAVAAIVLFLKIRVAGALTLIPYVAWLLFMAVVCIYAAGIS